MRRWRFIGPTRSDWDFGLAYGRSFDGWSLLIGPFKVGRERIAPPPRPVLAPTRSQRRTPTSDIVEQHPVLKAALEDALRRMPPDSHVHDLTDLMADYTLRFDLITRYDRKYLRDDPTARPPLQPIARTSGEWNAFLSDGDARDEVEKALEKHDALLSDVYLGRYR